MKTTQIFIDHLITGTLALIWIIFLVITVTGTSIYSFPSISNIENILFFLVLSIVYPLGIISDNIGDRILKSWSKRIRLSIEGGNQSMRKLLLTLNNESVTEYFDYLRTRIRLCRSAGINFFLITISSLMFTYRHVDNDFKNTLLILQLVIGLGITILAFFSWKLLMETFAKGIAKRYKELK